MSIQAQPRRDALKATISALIEFACSEPTNARFLTNEPLAGGPLALDARDRSIAVMGQLIAERTQGLDAQTPVPDFSSHALLGGIHRLLAPRLRRGEPLLDGGLLEDLTGWVASYEQSAGRQRWSSLRALPPPPDSPFLPEERLRAPEPLRRGKGRLPAHELHENQRLRIMFAAAELAEQKGYTATTVGDINKCARVDGRVFYRMFSDKQEAFMAIHEFGFGRVMDVTAGAFFAGTTWPERNWEGGRAFTQFLEHNPMIAHVGFVEAYAVGPGAVQRLEDSHTAFAMLLQEGYQYVVKDARPSRLVLEAIITTIFEIVYQQARRSGKPQLAGLLAHFTYLVLAPFIGAAQANAFIDAKLAEGG
jgi:AcrR family transcriptional regulator